MNLPIFTVLARISARFLHLAPCEANPGPPRFRNSRGAEPSGRALAARPSIASLERDGSTFKVIIMSSARKNRHVFRPSLDGASLEDRQLLATGVTTVFDLGSGVVAVVPPTPAFASTLGPSVSAQAARQLNLQNQQAVRQFRRAFLQQARAASGDLRQAVAARAAQTFANGTPTAQQMADLNMFVNGALNATAFRLSSQAALLPNASSGLVGSIQNSLLGPGQSSLMNRIQAQAFANRNAGSPQSLQNAIARQVNRTFAGVNNQVNTFFNTTPLARMSVDATGQPVQFQQFLGNRVVNQLGNTLGALAQSVPTVGSAILSTTPATTDAQQAFVSQLQRALQTTTFQVGSDLSMFQNTDPTLIPALQSGFFGTGVTSPGLFGLLSNLPVDSADFPAATTGLFNGNFADIVSPLNTFFGLPISTTPTLPTGNISGVFAPAFTGTDFFNGFNNGFSSGFIGFGTAPTDFNTNFGTGFNSVIDTANTAFGFAPPSLGSGTAIGFGPSPVPGTSL